MSCWCSRAFAALLYRTNISRIPCGNAVVASLLPQWRRVHPYLPYRPYNKRTVSLRRSRDVAAPLVRQFPIRQNHQPRTCLKRQIGAGLILAKEIAVLPGKLASAEI